MSQEQRKTNADTPKLNKKLLIKKDKKTPIRAANYTFCLNLDLTKDFFSSYNNCCNKYKM